MLAPTDRQKVIERLDENHIRALAAQARDWFRDTEEAVELCYQPGDATWYSLIITPVEATFGAPGGGGIEGDERRTYIEANYHEKTTYVVVYAQQGTAIWFKPGVDDPYWSAGKLTDNQASATAIGVLLEEIFGFSGN